MADPRPPRPLDRRRGDARRRGAALLGLLWALAWAGPARAQEEAVPAPGPAGADVVCSQTLIYDPAEGLLTGHGPVRVRNSGSEPLTELLLVLYPDRFRTIDPAIDDFNFDRYYVRWFDPGWIELDRATTPAGAPLAVETPGPGSPRPPGHYAVVRLAAPVPPGEWAEVVLDYRVQVPDRLGSFGRRGGRLVLEAGALPYLPLAGAGGRPDPLAPPRRAAWALDLEVRPAPGALDDGWNVLLGPGPAERLEGPGLRYRARFTAPTPFVAVGPELAPLLDAEAQGVAPAISVHGEEGDEERATRLGRLAQEAAGALHAYLGADLPPGRVVFVQAPLRDRFVHPAGGEVVLYSDRLFHVFPLLKPFHELEVGRGVILALIDQALGEVDLGADRGWVVEGLAWVVTTAWVEGRGGLKGRQVREGLGWLGFIPAIDRILNAPRFPGSDLYYGRFHEPPDAVPDAFDRALSRRARGRLVFEKLREKLPEGALDRLVRETLVHPEGPAAAADVRGRAAALVGQDLGPFFAMWLEPAPPRQNLALGEVETLEVLPDGTRRVRVHIRREGDPRVGEVGEPVDVELEGPGDAPVRLRWPGFGARGHVEGLLDDAWFPHIELDPDLRVAQAYRGDDETPLIAKVLVNRARVSLDLNNGKETEAALGLTIHPLHDYRHAIVLDGYWEQAERGITVGYGYGFGTQLTERTFGARVSTYVNAARLVDNVVRKRATSTQPQDGDLISFGFGIDFDTRAFDANPTWGFGLGFGVEHADRVLGTDFRFDLYAASAQLVYSVVRGTQLGVEVSWATVQGGIIPVQRLLDVGGQGAVRGVETSEFLGTHQFVVRTELRQMVLEDLDIPLLWLAWLRKVQVMVFLDAGDVGEETSDLFRSTHNWKWGTGFGVRAFLDALGVTNVTVRFDVGFRIDETRELGPEFYLGAGQSF